MRIPIIIKAIDDVCPSAYVGEGDKTGQEVQSCFKCGGIVFYSVVEYKYLESKWATDTCQYCAVCGTMQGGIVNDPFDELIIRDGIQVLKTEKEK